jgi:predicted amidophosphoribosyltransferase
MTKVSENHEGNNANTLLSTEPCPNCKETIEQCACMRNICHKCGKPVGNITFTICYECWDIEFPPKF